MAEAELAVRDGYAPPADLPRGECIFTRLDDGGIRVDHADPRILISAELIDAMVDHPAPDAWVDLRGCTTYDGALLKVDAVNRMLVYRIIEYVPSVHGFIAEWPD